MSHCDPTQYIYDDDLSKKTVDAHLWINSHDPDHGCESEDKNHKQKFEKGVRLVFVFCYNKGILYLKKSSCLITFLMIPEKT